MAATPQHPGGKILLMDYTLLSPVFSTDGSVCGGTGRGFGLYTIFGYQYGTVYGMHKGSGGGGRILSISRAIVLQCCKQCRWRGQYKDD